MDGAERSVIFKLLAVVDPASKTALASFAKQLETAQEKSTASTASSSREVVRVTKETEKTSVSAHAEAIAKKVVIDKEYTDKLDASRTALVEKEKKAADAIANAYKSAKDKASSGGGIGGGIGGSIGGGLGGAAASAVGGGFQSMGYGLGGAAANAFGGAAGTVGTLALANPVTALSLALGVAAAAAYKFAKDATDDHKQTKLNTTQSYLLGGLSNKTFGYSVLGEDRAKTGFDASVKSASKAEDYHKRLKEMNDADHAASKKLESEQEHAQRVLLQITHQRHEKEKEIAKTARDAAAASLKSSEHELKNIDAQIKAKQAGNMSARESFGLKSEDEQAEIIDIKRRVDRGDPDVTGEELSRIKGLSDRTDKQVSNIANRKASGAGFGIFDQEDQAEMANLTKLQKKLQLEVKQKTEVVVKMDRDIEAEAQKIAKQVVAEQDKQDTALSKRVAEIVKEQAELKKRFFQRNQGGTL